MIKNKAKRNEGSVIFKAIDSESVSLSYQHLELLNDNCKLFVNMNTVIFNIHVPHVADLPVRFVALQFRSWRPNESGARNYHVRVTLDSKP